MFTGAESSGSCDSKKILMGNTVSIVNECRRLNKQKKNLPSYASSRNTRVVSYDRIKSIGQDCVP